MTSKTLSREEVFELMDIDNPAEVEYFEQMADLIECDDNIEYDDFFVALSGVSEENMGEFAEHYFEELMNAVPDDAEDIYGLFDSIQQRLMLLAEDLSTEESRRNISDELYRFRDWYHNPDNAKLDGEPCSVMDAVFEARAAKLDGGFHEYSFAGAMDYELGDLAMSVGSFSKIDI